MHVIVVVGARPNFVKIAPVMEAFKKRHGLSVTLVHTGQHYDDAMSSAFFKDLAMPEPDIYLGVGSGGHGEQTGKVLAALEDVLSKKSADIVMVAGAVNSTVACALAAAKCQIPVAHVEAGLCSFDRTMPEEINRVVTDALADYLFTPSVDADWNLIREGVPKKRIYRVGNVMIDTLRRYEHDARARKTSQNFNFSLVAMLSVHCIGQAMWIVNKNCAALLEFSKACRISATSSSRFIHACGRNLMSLDWFRRYIGLRASIPSSRSAILTSSDF